jgi:AcrR family transcriptional regulator
MIETKVRILDAAERLIAEHGLEVSLRTITTEAGVNLAAVNYHFQSKDALVDAVVARRIEPINRARLERLDALEREYPSGELPLEGVLEAFLAPVTQTGHDEHVRILFGRLYSQPDEFLKRVFNRHLHDIVERFQGALARALPGTSQAERMSCMMFTAGAMVHVMAWSRLLGIISNGAVDPGDTQLLTDRIVAFSAGGFRSVARRAVSLDERTLHA